MITHCLLHALIVKTALVGLRNKIDEMIEKGEFKDKIIAPLRINHSEGFTANVIFKERYISHMSNFDLYVSDLFPDQEGIQRYLKGAPIFSKYNIKCEKQDLLVRAKEECDKHIKDFEELLNFLLREKVKELDNEL